MKSVPSLVLVILVLLSGAFSTEAQDSVLLKPKWQDYFSRTVHDRYAFLKIGDFDKIFEYGRYYDGLLVFRDSTKTSEEVKIRYRGIADLCDRLTQIEYGKPNKWGEMAYNFVPQHKSELKMFVFADITFIWQVSRFKNKFAGIPDRWSIVVLNGPFFATRSFYFSKTASGSVLPIETEFLQKYDLSAGRHDLKYFDHLSFKKTMSKSVAENTELVAKIMNGEEGYQKENTMKILIEYNDWVKQQNPDIYRKTLAYPKQR